MLRFDLRNSGAFITVSGKYISSALRFPIGLENFRKLIENQLVFIDKTLFIKSVMDDSSDAILITRPRRFGKTLNLSMLHHFFASEVWGEKTSGLFEHLKISEYKEYMQHQGRYPVIFLTMKDIKDGSFSVASEKFAQLMSGIYSQHRYLLKSEKLYPEEKIVFETILATQALMSVLENSLKKLCEYLSRYHQINPIILVDEYDTPIQSAYFHNYYDEMVSFLRNFLGAALKTNPYLHKAVLTGVLRISRESLFSDLNNIRTYSLLSQQYAECFGFTEEEVVSLLDKAELKHLLQEVRKWYNGYQIGEMTIYNPWSIINFLGENGRLQSYWVNTSDNQLIREQLSQGSLSFKQDFETLLQDQSINKLINEGMVFKNLKHNEGALWNLLFMAGYLKPTSCDLTNEGALCELKIPNFEVRGLFQRNVKEWLSGVNDSQWYMNFLNELLQGHVEQFEERLKRVMLQTLSSWDVATNKQEAFYHGFMIGLTAALTETCELKSNRESGEGRYDVMIIPYDVKRYAIILEFKAIEVEEEEKLTKAAEKALQQISSHQYSQDLKQRKIANILMLGVAFCGKQVKVASAKSK